ncbi:MAG: preprotein translocase subunit SecA [Gemmataceae bacterium]|nr:preprotein translocase subunit SecA [Gemmataceae bacterium]
MANASNTAEMSFIEKIGDGLSSISEGFVGAITRILGTSNDNYVRKLGYIRPRGAGQQHRVITGSILGRVNDLEPKMKALSDTELAGLTPQFRERLSRAETLDDILPEAFAACREAGRRTKNMRHFDTQILGGIVLHRGNIAEMATGEGKTLVATLPAYLNAIEGKGVHVITVNDYLARRDCEWMLPIYTALGVTAGFIQSDMEPMARRAAYECDITYGTNSEFGFDYLRDNMKPARWGDPRFNPWYQQCQRRLHYAIIDEVDNILIDEARTPLIISGPAFSDVARYAQANDIAVRLTELQKRGEGPYYEVKEKEHTCHLTDAGVRKAEELAEVESFYTAGNTDWPHMIDNALKAHHLYKRDKNYMVMPDRDTNELGIIIIDEHTGRAMFGRQWSDGLHQAVEAKHARDGVKIKQETQTLATVTLQNYFKLYEKLAGMTGTAMTEANEFWKIYKLEVIGIPTNRPMLRINSSDLVYRYEKEKWDAVVEEVVKVHATGRPILIGTASVEKSEILSTKLNRVGIKHELLNAKPEFVARESEIVAQAGRIGAVTIATNMAGRGTDIILGGNPETLAWARLRHEYPSRLEVPPDIWKRTVDEIESTEKMKEQGRQVAELGGLHIIGTERHDSRRIDNQLRGRAGRQGDPGSSRFYLSLQDDLMRIYGGERMAALLTRLGMQDGESIESRMVSRQIEKAQKKVEEQHFESRKNLLEYDEVMDHQRKRVYGFRQAILNGANPKASILEMIDRQIDTNVDRLLQSDYGPASFAEFAGDRLGAEFEADDFRKTNFEEACQLARDRAIQGLPGAFLDMLEENLSTDMDESEWQWQAMARQIEGRYGLKFTDRDLKRIGRDNLMDHLQAECEKVINEIDLSDGEKYLSPEWSLQSVCDWANRKFMLGVSGEDLAGLTAVKVKARIKELVRAAYLKKETEFPVMAAVNTFMSDRGQGGAAKYDRAGFYAFTRFRFPALADRMNEDDFRTLSRSKLIEMVSDLGRGGMPAGGQDAIRARVAEAFEGATKSESGDARELADWFRTTFGIDIPVDHLTGITEEGANHILWNAFDDRYRPEMRGLERSVLLGRLDDAWKKHLLTMDHLRSGIGLVSYAQVDPKTEYKREGMKAFDEMWAALEDRITDAVFRMEEEEGFQEVTFTTVHEAAPRFESTSQPHDGTSTNAASSEKVLEPIRNSKERVGRNDPCPCGSGKKYKNCHMRSEPARK